MYSWKVLVFVFVLRCVVDDVGVHGFNVETSNATVRVFIGPPGSKFGFTVALYTGSGDGAAGAVLVGAPEANTTQPGITRGGAVYQCSTADNTCSQIDFDTSGDKFSIDYPDQREEIKSEQWFGATLTARPGGHILACAPRYVSTTDHLDRWLPIGQCFLKTPEGSFLNYKPCYNNTRRDRGHHGQYVYCLSGMSAALDEDGSWLAIGTPGSKFLQGQLIAFDRTASLTKETAVKGTGRANTYRGYSVASGQFNADAELEFVVGEPRNQSLNGSASVFTKDMRYILTLVGGQFGEYFGASVCVSDFDDDGNDDIAIGAPMYSEQNPFLPDIGRVYIFFQDYTHTFPDSRKLHLEGWKKKGGRFGTSVAALGDINNDNYNDLAVGAPYEDDTGIVYIYHGPFEGVKAQAAQRIVGSVPSGSPVRGFGFSVTGELDLDNNGYPDLAVGAYGSDQVVFYRSRPVVYINAETALKTFDDFINLDVKECVKRTVTCFRVDVCTYTIGGSSPQSVDINATLVVDSRKPLSGRRASFLQSDGNYASSITRSLPLGMCFTVFAHIADDGIDKLAPITIELNYTLDTSRITEDVLPMLNFYTPTNLFKQVHILKDCGPDNTCVPDLAVATKSEIDTFVYGTMVDFELVIWVSNTGEDAYSTELTLAYPTGVDFRDIEADYPVNCRPHSERRVIVCDLGNPFKRESNATYVLLLRASDASNNAMQLDFVSTLTSLNPESNDTLFDNKHGESVPLVAQIDIQGSGISEPRQATLNASSESNKYGPDIIQRFQVSNLGPSEIKKLQISILVPVNVTGGLELLHIPTQPFVKPEGDVTGVCSKTFITYAPSQVTSMDSTDEDIKIPPVLSCTADNGFVEVCARISCLTHDMRQESAAVLEVKLYPNIDTITKIQGDSSSVRVVSLLESTVLTTPYAVEITTLPRVTFQVTTEVVGPKVPETVALWIYVVAAVGGLLVLALCSVILCRCGFFKRTRVEDKCNEVDGTYASNAREPGENEEPDGKEALN